MKIFIKTISGQQHPLEVDESTQVSGVKKKIEDELGYDGTNMKIVFKGKVVQDDTITLAQAGVVENEFLVLVAKKKAVLPKKDEAKPAEPAEAPKSEAKEPAKEEPATEEKTTPAPAPAPAPQAEEPKPEEKVEEKMEAAPAAPPTADPDAPVDAVAAASVFATGAQLESVISGIMEMGFPREQVVRALRAAYNNPDRAVDYLMNGIPETTDLEPPAAGGAVPGATATPGADAPPGGGAGGFDPAMLAALQGLGAGGGLDPANIEAALAANPQLVARLQQMLQGQGAPQPQLSPLAQALQGIPQFDQIRALIPSNPQMLPQIINQLRESNPNLFNLINQNPQEFVQLLQNGIPGSGGGAGGAPPGPRPGEIRVTPEEKAAIDRLAALGFSQQAAAEAYLLCEKNEELAANFLFDNGNMDFDDTVGGDGDGAN